MSDAIYARRLRIVELGQMLFERRLTDAAGGNISARVGADRICITPRFSGSKHQWHLRPEQVIVSDLQGNLLEGEGQISREAKVHYRIYADFPDAQAIVHAHARNALVFASACQPIDPVLEDTLKFGTIRVAQYAPAHSSNLAEFVARELYGQDERIRKQAAGVLAPWHGLFVAGKDLEAAFDAVERIDTNARCILLGRLLPGKEPFDPQAIRDDLEDAFGRYA